MKIKTKINKSDLINSFCTANKTVNKMKRQLSECEKIFASEAMDKVLLSKIYKQLMGLKIKKRKRKIPQPNLKMGGRPK